MPLPISEASCEHLFSSDVGRGKTSLPLALPRPSTGRVPPLRPSQQPGRNRSRAALSLPFPCPSSPLRRASAFRMGVNKSIKRNPKSALQRNQLQSLQKWPLPGPARPSALSASSFQHLRVLIVPAKTEIKPGPKTASELDYRETLPERPAGLCSLARGSPRRLLPRESSLTSPASLLRPPPERAAS